MSTTQRLTLIGIYDFDPTLFDGLTLPEDYDKQTFIDSLLLEHGEKCVLYANPDFMKFSIGAWGRKWALELERIAQALKAEYDPIYNYDRHEEWTETDKPDVTTTRTHGDTLTRTNNNTDTQTNRYDVVSEQNVDGTAEHKVSADNSGNYQPESHDTTNAGKSTVSNDGTITDSHTGTVTDAHTGTVTDAEKGTRSNIEHKAHLYGNIGVTTSAQMVTEIVQQRFKYNLYATACKLFANDLLIGIY